MRYIFILFMGLMFIFSGCNRADIETKKRHFDAKLHKLNSYGIDINQTQNKNEKSSYLLKISNPNKSAHVIMQYFNQIEPQNEKKLAKFLEKVKNLKVEVNWQKYAKNEAKSVFVYVLGTGQEKEPLKTLLKEKTFGAYLTFKDEALKTIDIKDINKTISDKNGTLTLILKGAKIIIDKMATKKDPSSKMHLVISQAKIYGDIKAKQNKSQKIAFTLSNLRCDNDKPKEYLGKVKCLLPLIEANFSNKKEKVFLALKETTLNSNTTVKNKKVQSKGEFAFKDFIVAIKNATAPANIEVKNFKVAINMAGIDENIIQKFYQLTKEPSIDKNKTIKLLIEYMQAIFDKNAKIAYEAKFDSLAIHTQKSQKVDIVLKGLSEVGSAKFSETIEGNDTLKIDTIEVLDNKEKIFLLEKLIINANIKGFYNFLPKFFKVALINASKPNQNKLSKEEKKAFEEMGKKIFNYGFELDYNPIMFEKLYLQKEKLSLEQIKFISKILLKSNKIDFDKKIPPKFLLPLFQMQGELALSKKDLMQITKRLPPKAAAAILLYTKVQEENVIFKYQFKNGHFYVNGELVQ